MGDLPILDVRRPSPARMYDYYLGGCHNVAIDRHAARAAEAAWPGAARCAQANRSFLRRVVRYLVSRGIDQFLDLGAGAPTVGNVHEIAQRANPAARVVYVDKELVAVTANEMVLQGNPGATVIRADLRDTAAVLGHDLLRGLLDLTRPVAMLFVSVLPFIPDADDPAGLIRAYLAATAPGSYLVISHYDKAAAGMDGADELIDVYANTSNPITPRDDAEILNLFRGTELVPPGLVHALDWRPGDDEGLDTYRDRIPLRVGVARTT